MNLLMITGYGGADLAAGKRGAFYNTLEEFRQYWNRIDIICPRVENFKIKNSLKIENWKLEIFNDVYIHPSPWPLWRQPEWIFKKGRELSGLRAYDLMTAHEYPPFYNGIGAALLHKKTGIPYVLEIHHIPGYPKASGGKEKIYRWLTEKFIKYDTAKALAVRVVNKKQVSEFLAHAGVDSEKIKYIPSMYIDLDVFKPSVPSAGGAVTPDALPPAPGVETSSTPGAGYDVVFAGRLERNKNVGMLLDALSIVKRHMSNISLLIIGDGPEKKCLELKAKSYPEKLHNGMSNLKADFTGWLSSARDVAYAYNKSKIFVNPSLNEGGPRVALEAMACGLPVITTRVGIMNDIIKDGENGFFADWSAGDLAAKIVKLLGDETLRNRFADAGVKIAGRFEKKSVIKNYADELKQIISDANIRMHANDANF